MVKGIVTSIVVQNIPNGVMTVKLEKDVTQVVTMLYGTYSVNDNAETVGGNPVDVEKWFNSLHPGTTVEVEFTPIAGVFNTIDQAKFYTKT